MNDTRDLPKNIKYSISEPENLRSFSVDYDMKIHLNDELFNGPLLFMLTIEFERFEETETYRYSGIGVAAKQNADPYDLQIVEQLFRSRLHIPFAGKTLSKAQILNFSILDFIPQSSEVRSEGFELSFNQEANPEDEVKIFAKLDEIGVFTGDIQYQKRLLIYFYCYNGGNIGDDWNIMLAFSIINFDTLLQFLQNGYDVEPNE